MTGILTAYAVRDPEIGYCQGMSDLASAFVAITQDDALAFWGFERLMRRVRANFKIDDMGFRAVTSALYRVLQVIFCVCVCWGKGGSVLGGEEDVIF